MYEINQLRIHEDFRLSDVGERELLAIIFTDAVDSTARTASDEDYSLRILLADLDYMRNEAAVRGGTVLKNTGDGLLISFKSAVDAVECALSIQRGFADRAEQTAFRHKIGVHIGDVIKKDGDIYGSGVNTASRLVAQCPAGGICMSSTLYELVKQNSQIGNLKVENFQVTNMEPPIKAYRVRPFLDDHSALGSGGGLTQKKAKKTSGLRLQAILVSILLGFSLLLGMLFLGLKKFGGLESLKSEKMSDQVLELVAPFNGHIYRFVLDPKKWNDANRIAQKMGGHLVTITSQEEQNLVWGLVTSQTNVPRCTWLGFSDEEKEGQWKWITGEEVGYTAWVHGQPDNGYGCQNYGWIGWSGDGRWDDGLEGYKLPFVVELKQPFLSGLLKKIIKKTNRPHKVEKDPFMGRWKWHTGEIRIHDQERIYNEAYPEYSGKWESLGGGRYRFSYGSRENPAAYVVIGSLNAEGTVFEGMNQEGKAPDRAIKIADQVESAGSSQSPAGLPLGPEVAQRLQGLRSGGRPDLAEKLEEKIKKALETARRFPGSRVVVGKVKLADHGKDVRLVNAQMEILEEGLFAGEVRDLQSPIGFTLQGYLPNQFQPVQKKGEIVDVGEITLQPLGPNDGATLNLKIEGNDDSRSYTVVKLFPESGPINTPHNGTAPRGSPGWEPSLELAPNEKGEVSKTGLSPGPYYLTVSAPNYLKLEKRVMLPRGSSLDLGVIRLLKQEAASASGGR